MVENPLEIAQAAVRAKAAETTFLRIMSLPKKKGSTVRWVNGVTWTRVGDNEWVPDHIPSDGRTWPSTHIAEGNWAGFSEPLEHH